MFMLKKTHRAELQPYLDERGWLIKAVEPLSNLGGGLRAKVEFLVKKYQALTHENRHLYRQNDGLRADVRAAEAAYEKAAAELAHWKKFGQLRDPATGRLIPKPKVEANG